MIKTQPDAFIFMKVGNHAGEDFEEILERKNLEFKEAGRIFWGYGGTACHPINQVQPFVKASIKKQGKIYLFMQTINSKADPDIIPATEYSEDGVDWKPIPDGIEVIGSRYALVLGEIKPGELEIPQEEYMVGIGPSRGKYAFEYIKGHVDKACLSKAMPPDFKTGKIKNRKIEYQAELLKPYAVLLRS